MPALADVPQYIPNAGVRDTVVFTIEVPIGASGAVGTIVAPWPSVTVTKNGTGTYDFVVPPCTRLNVTASVLSADATPTILAAVPLARSASAGTFTLATLATIAGGAADGQNGDTILVQCIAETSR